MDLAWTTATCHIVKKEEHNKKTETEDGREQNGAIPTICSQALNAGISGETRLLKRQHLGRFTPHFVRRDNKLEGQQIRQQHSPIV